MQRTKLRGTRSSVRGDEPREDMRRLLIANRGEIARRIVRTAHRMGIETVAVFSEADAGAMHLSEATVAYALGGKTSLDSYLRIDKLIEAARVSGADAVHPGYGFLSENADFAQAVIDAGLIWVGPAPSNWHGGRASPACRATTATISPTRALQPRPRPSAIR